MHPATIIALFLLCSTVATATEITMNVDMQAIKDIDGNMDFHSQNSTISIPVKTTSGNMISKNVKLNVTVPFNWNINLTINGTEILTLEGEATLNSARYIRTYFDNTQLKVNEETPVLVLTSEAVEAKLIPSFQLKQYSGIILVEAALDSDGDGIFKEFEKSTMSVKPQGDIVEVEFPPLASAIQVASFRVNASDNNGILMSMSGKYDFSKNVAVGIETFMDSTELISSSLGVEYGTGQIVINLPNDAFMKSKGNITAVSTKYIEVTVKSNRTEVSGNVTGQLFLKIVERNNTQPLDKVLVTVTNEDSFVKTELTNNGTALFNLTPDQYSVIVQKDGYYEENQNITVGFKPVKNIIVLERMPTTSDKIASTVGSGLKNPILSVLALAILVVVLVVAWRRRR